MENEQEFVTSEQQMEVSGSGEGPNFPHCDPGLHKSLNGIFNTRKEYDSKSPGFLFCELNLNFHESLFCACCRSDG